MALIDNPYLPIKHLQRWRVVINHECEGLVHCVAGPDFKSSNWFQETDEATMWSIDKWAFILRTYVENPEIWYIYDGAESTCGLCKAHPGCFGCPIAEMTDKEGCRATPYHTYREAHKGDGCREKAMALAAEMLHVIVGVYNVKLLGDG